MSRSVIQLIRGLSCPAERKRADEFGRNIRSNLFKLRHLFSFLRIWIFNRIGRPDLTSTVRKTMIQKLNSSFLNNLVHLMNLMIDFMYVPDYKSANFLIDSLLAESKKRNLSFFEGISHIYKASISYR